MPALLPLPSDQNQIFRNLIDDVYIPTPAKEMHFKAKVAYMMFKKGLLYFSCFDHKHILQFNIPTHMRLQNQSVVKLFIFPLHSLTSLPFKDIVLPYLPTVYRSSNNDFLVLLPSNAKQYLGEVQAFFSALRAVLLLP